MKFVLFLIFVETSVIPLADYETLAECQVVQKELEEAKAQPSETDFMAAIMIATAMYQCLAVPDTYDW